MDEAAVSSLKECIATTVKTALQDALEKELDKSFARLELRLSVKIDSAADEILAALVQIRTKILLAKRSRL